MRSVKDLAELPIVDKETMLRDPDRFRDRSLPTALVQHTGGTSGRTLTVMRGVNEVVYIREFFTEVTKDHFDKQPILIQLSGGTGHGMGTPMPYGGPLFTLEIDDIGWSRQAAEIITRPWEFLDCPEQPVVLSGMEWCARKFTCMLARQGFDFSESPVVALTTMGDFVPRRLRRWYEDLWGCPVNDRYSMSEVFGGASTCRQCGCWHFDPLTVGECVSLDRSRPVHAGMGVLVLTSLFPFVQKQPFIRYWSGDLVEVTTDACPVDPFGFTYHGRLANCAVHESPRGPEAIIYAADLYEVLDEFPDIARVKLDSSFGQLKFVLERREGEPPEHVLRLETHYLAHYYPERAEALRGQVRRAVLERHALLAQLVEREQVKLTVETALPGSLEGFFPSSSWIE